MNLDDELCLCFHVTKRKVVSWLRIERPQRVGQLSECYGAGTGCGWCRAYMKQLFEASRESRAESNQAAGGEPTAEEYAAMRSRYVRGGGGTPPPGATPID
jgi:NAD(P)H-nitrite reductase large subunit